MWQINAENRQQYLANECSRERERKRGSKKKNTESRTIFPLEIIAKSSLDWMLKLVYISLKTYQFVQTNYKTYKQKQTHPHFWTVNVLCLCVWNIMQTNPDTMRCDVMPLFFISLSLSVSLLWPWCTQCTLCTFNSHYLMVKSSKKNIFQIKFEQITHTNWKPHKIVYS